jgi:hypothetical protein
MLFLLCVPTLYCLIEKKELINYTRHFPDKKSSVIVYMCVALFGQSYLFLFNFKNKKKNLTSLFIYLKLNTEQN